MPRKKRNALPSGSVRIQRRYTDEQGVTHRKSFTGTTRAEAEALAAEWEQHRSQVRTRITVAQAVERYIATKEAVLSPSTVAGYKASYRNHFLGSSLERLELLSVTGTDVQLWLSDLSREVGPKTVRNAHALLTATLQLFMPDFQLHVTLPPKRKPDLYCPSAKEVRAVIDAATDPELRAAILLAAVGTLRRGEICALTWDDVSGSTIHVRRCMVQDSANAWVVKDPKTYESNRRIPVTDEVIRALDAIPRHEDGRILRSNPSQISHHFAAAVKRSGVHPFRFHDLRHFSASQMHLMGIPDKYIEARGGWRPGSTVMKRTYQEVISLEQKKQDKRILEIFSAM